MSCYKSRWKQRQALISFVPQDLERCKMFEERCQSLQELVNTVSTSSSRQDRMQKRTRMKVGKGVCLFFSPWRHFPAMTVHVLWAADALLWRPSLSGWCDIFGDPCHKNRGHVDRCCPISWSVYVLTAVDAITLEALMSRIMITGTNAILLRCLCCSSPFAHSRKLNERKEHGIDSCLLIATLWYRRCVIHTFFLNAWCAERKFLRQMSPIRNVDAFTFKSDQRTYLTYHGVLMEDHVYRCQYL